MLELIVLLLMWTAVAALYWVFLFLPDKEVPLWVRANLILAVFTFAAVGLSTEFMPQKGLVALLILSSAFFLWPIYLLPGLHIAVGSSLYWAVALIVLGLGLSAGLAGKRVSWKQAGFALIAPIFVFYIAISIQNAVSEKQMFNKADDAGLTIENRRTLLNSIKSRDREGPRHATAKAADGKEYYWSYRLVAWLPSPNSSR